MCAPNTQDVDAAIQLYFQEQQLSSSSDEEADGAADTAAEVRALPVAFASVVRVD